MVIQVVHPIVILIVKHMRRRASQAFLLQLFLNSPYVEAFPRVHCYPIFAEYPLEIPPSVDVLKIVCAYDQGEFILWLPLAKRIQSPDRVLRRRHHKLDVIDPDLQFRVPLHRSPCSVIPCPSRISANPLFQRIFRRHYQIDHVEAAIAGEVFHYGQVSDVERVERTGIYCDSHGIRL